MGRQWVRLADIGWGLFFGATLAVVVWYVVNAWYYLTYDPPDPTGTVEFGRNAARTLLLPRNFIGFGLHRPGIRSLLARHHRGRLELDGPAASSIGRSAESPSSPH